MSSLKNQISTIRTFRAKDSRTALRAVKEVLGPKAVILSTRDVPGGPLQPKAIEVTAGLASDETLAAISASLPPPRALSGAAAYARSPPDSASMSSWSEDARRQFEHWLDQGLERSLAQKWVQAALDSEARSADELTAHARTELTGSLRVARAPWLRGERRVVTLVGPTGVGKTTTIAKLAAKALMESQMRVALVTVDTYRIGASEQIARYGAIMRIPTFVAKDAGELSRVMGRTRDRDLVLIDTAGRSLSEAVFKQAEMVRTVPDVQLWLTVSAATGAREVASVTERYRSLRPDGLVVTKIDEAVGGGSMLSATTRLECPLMCLTDGQGVPENLHAWSTLQWVDFAMGGPARTSAMAMGGK